MISKCNGNNRKGMEMNNGGDVEIERQADIQTDDRKIDRERCGGQLDKEE